MDGHHTVEDTGIVLGEAIKKAVGDKKGINRYGYFILPMDEVLALCAIDLSGRPYLNFECEFTVPKVGELDTELVKEFFYAVSYSAGMNLHIKMLSSGNNHHMIEAIFKAFAKALDQAVSYTEGNGCIEVPKEVCKKIRACGPYPAGIENARITMIIKKFVPCIYLYHEHAVRNLTDTTIVDTDPVRLADYYCEHNADELIVFDMSEGDAEHEAALDIIKEICAKAEVDVIGAGNVKRMEDINKLLYAGCKKAVLDYEKESNIEISGGSLPGNLARKRY